MIVQWLIIAALVAAAGVYLVRLTRQTLKQPFCSDCAGCDTPKWVKLAAKMRRSSDSQKKAV